MITRWLASAGRFGKFGVGFARCSQLARPASDVEELREAWESSEKAQEVHRDAEMARKEEMRRSGDLDWIENEQVAVSRLPEASNITSDLDPLTIASHRPILGRLSPTLGSTEETEKRFSRLRHHGLWLRAFLKNPFSSKPWMAFEILSKEIILDFKRGRFTVTKKSVTRHYKGPVYQLVLLDAEMQSIVSTHRMVATGIESKLFPGVDEHVPLPGNCIFTEAPLQKRMRTWVPICPVNAEQSTPLAAGVGHLVRPRRDTLTFATVDVEPGVRPPQYLTADLTDRDLLEEIYLADVEAPAGCSIYLARKMKGPLFRIMPKQSRVPQYDSYGFRLDLFERDG